MAPAAMLRSQQVVKRAGNLFPEIIDLNNLRLAFWKASQGKRRRPSVVSFATHLDANLAHISRAIATHRFEFGTYRQFEIHDPKRRTITAPAFDIRIAHHAIINVCEPYFERRLIDDTFACRRRRGQITCVDRAHEFTSKYPYVIKMDIRSYFDSIDHFILKSLLRRMFKDANLLRAFDLILSSYHAVSGRGLPIGALTSQHFANAYLSVLDRFVKQNLRIRGVVRYMDDFAIWGDSPGELRAVASAVAEYLAQELNLQPKRGRLVFRTKGGFDFLGFRIFPTHVAPSRRSRHRYRMRMRLLYNQLNDGLISESEFQHRSTSVTASIAAASAKCWRWKNTTLNQLR